MMEPFINDCEDPELVDLEMAVPHEEFEMLPAFGNMEELGFDTIEFEEHGAIQEEFETALLEEGAHEEPADIGAEIDQFPMLDEPAPISLDESSALTFDAFIKTMKKYPGLKITFSF